MSTIDSLDAPSDKGRPDSKLPSMKRFGKDQLNDNPGKTINIKKGGRKKINSMFGRKHSEEKPKSRACALF